MTHRVPYFQVGTRRCAALAVTAIALHSAPTFAQSSGACCDTAGGCTVTTASNCSASSRFRGVGTVCSTNNICPPTGGGFTLTWSSIDGGGGSRSEPSIGGGFSVSGVIGQNDAGSPPLTGGAFSLSGGFLPGGIPCWADFNGSGALTVQDIFDFLAAYFPGNPGADFNHSGSLSVQDIFDFLAAYFAGC